jgi:hypothetical protein
MKRTTLLIICMMPFLTMASFSQGVFGKGNLALGFGGGVNFSSANIRTEVDAIQSIDNATVENTYSPLFGSIGSQYFFHAEYTLGRFAFALVPGTYTQSFTRTIFTEFDNQEAIDEKIEFKLRYTNIPLQVKSFITSSKLKTYVGGQISYGRLISGNEAFIKSSFTAGPIVGLHYPVFPLTLVFTSGYQIGLHSITSKTDRLSSENILQAPGDLSINNLFASISILFDLNVEPPKGALKCPPTQ